MPERNRVSPLQVRGGWRGLNTTQSPRELGPQDAAVANNVIFRDGAIVPRPPFEVDGQFSPNFGFPVGKVLAAAQWMSPRGTTSDPTRVNVVHVGTVLHAADVNGTAQATMNGVQDRQGSFVFANTRLYYLDRFRVWVLGNTENNLPAWNIVGIPKPTSRITGGPIGASNPGTGEITYLVTTVPGTFPGALVDNTAYQFGFTYYSSFTDSESNAVLQQGSNFNGVAGAGNSRLLQLGFGTWPVPYGITHIRVYRRNVTAGEPFILFALCPVPGPGQFFQAEGAPLGILAEFGTFANGPFGPVKNGIPENASVGLFYKGRMFYDDLKNPNLLRYSEDSHPAHVDPLNFVILDDDGGQITGMAELAGQLVILKERSIWILSGVILTTTNESLALGVDVGANPAELYRTKARTGCANAAGGNGAIVCGTPPRVYYNAVDGLYVFDGLNETPVGRQIQPTWREFVGDATLGRQQAVTYSVDPTRRILFMVNLTVDEVRAQILAFHYDLGAWSVLLNDDLSGDNPSCLLQTVGIYDPTAPDDPSEPPTYHELRPTMLAVAVGVFRILFMNERRLDLPMPEFEYRTGRLVVVDGLDKHFYAVKWYHDEVLGDGFAHGLRFGFRTHPRNVEEYKAADLTDGLRTYQKVSESGSDIELIVKNDPSVDARWSPQVRIVGFEADVELIGQR
jgi:hypothetical protein